MMDTNKYSFLQMNNIRLYLITLPLFLIASCGGGGEPGVNPASGLPGSDSSPYPLTAVNGNITGKLWISGDGATFDLETGEYKK